MMPSDPDDRDALAGEYVLGLLDEAAAREVEASLGRDADLAARVAAWEARLMPALDAVAPVTPDPGLWRRIEHGLAPPGAARTTSPVPPGRGGRAARAIWNNAALWRGATALATAAAIVLAIVPLRSAVPVEPAPRFFAILQNRDASGQETGPGWLIQVAQDGTVRSSPLAAIEPGQGRSLQLWTLWDPARGPVSLGVLPPGGSVRLPAESLPVIGGGQLFEITLEPEAGSPTGRPTGRILFIGRASSAPVRSL